MKKNKIKNFYIWVYFTSYENRGGNVYKLYERWGMKKKKY